MPIRGLSPPTPTPPPRETSASTSAPASSSASSSTATAPAAPTAPSPPSTSVDHFDARPLEGTPTAAPPGQERGGLPDTLLASPHARVVHGDDPGDFYCEHAFFTAQQTAATSTSTAYNAQGESLVGFLHVPRDAATGTAAPVDDQAARHQGTREVVGAALRSYVDDARATADRLGGAQSPVRVLLTGYEQWGSVQNNPTGDFVAHADNVDAAMGHAFGPHLVTPKGTRVGGDEHSDVLRYEVREPATGRRREVLIEARRLPVTDDAINGSPRSLQAAIGRFAPHGVISMGVHGGSDHIAEHHADDGGINVVDGRQVHDDAMGPRTNLAPNFALPRAIFRGSQPLPVPLGTLSPDSDVRAHAARRARNS
jgi:pyrrolidone-carboxylate peptidase